MKEAEKKFKELFEKSGDAILILENEQFVDCNQATVHMLKYDTKEMFLDVHPSKLSPEIQTDGRRSDEKADEMMQIALEKGTNRFEWDHMKSDGEVFPVEVLLTVISNNPDKRVIHTVWRDITDRKMAETALKDSEEKYRGIIETVSDWIWEIDTVGKYTFSSSKVFAILGYSEKEVLGKTPFDFILETEKNLKESEARLRESNNTKDKFFAILAHDLISPSNTMLGFSKLLVGNYDIYDEQTIKKFLGIIDKDMQKTYRLLENLLLWSRAQSGAIEFNPQRENLYLLTGETISLLKQSAENKDITLVANVSEDIYVHVDRNMMLSVFRNLISNAIKFTPKGGTIEVGCMVSDVETYGHTSLLKNNIQIYVKDNGFGMETEIQTKLFKITENVSTKGTEGEDGTGLGLILCKEFVKKHGGKIWVESKVGKGSEFIFTIPKE